MHSMHFSDIVKRDGRTVSFEFFPPRGDAGWETLFGTLRELEPLAPSFVSVTYGAGGTTRDRTHDLVVRLRNETTLDPVPHLTCVAQNRAQVDAILTRYAAAGVSNILALRGDLPPDMTLDDQSTAEYRHAADLVRHIRAFNESKQHPDPRGFGIGIAGFPEGHPETPNQLVQMEHLKAKTDAGADWICTQMFFDNAMFYDWRDRCRLAGITVPLVAGIMPITSRAGLRRMADLAGGTRFPAPLLKALDRCDPDDEESVARVGIHWATEQCRDLLDHGVDGLHLYTLNRSNATTRIYQTLGARDSVALRE